MATRSILSLKSLPVVCGLMAALALAGCSKDTSDSSASSTPATEAVAHNGSKATTPKPRDQEYEWMSIAEWNERFQDDVKIAKEGNVGLLFVGDSITQGWPSPLWENSFGAFNPANFGIGGDHTGNVLWRLQNTDLSNLHPKVIVLLIGVNNFFHNNDQPEDVFQGVKAVVDLLRIEFPDAKILLNGILPHKENADDPMRQMIIETNQKIQTLGDHSTVYYRDYGSLFLAEDGSIPKELMPDSLHPAEPGYVIWADAMLPQIQVWMEE